VADRSVYLGTDGRFAPNLQGVSEALTQEMGLFQGKRPCPFHFVALSCKDSATTCRFYH